jgi:hypothetical protein
MRARHAAVAIAAVTAALLVAGLPAAGAKTVAAAAFSCNLKWSAGAAKTGSVIRITGSCAEGPFLGVLVEVPRNRIAARPGPQVDGARRCTRPGPRSVRCTMRSASSHFGARIPVRERKAFRPKVTFFDRAGKVLRWVSTGGANSPLGASAPPPASTGFPQTPLQAEGSFTGGSGGCPVVTAFRANFIWTVQGTALRIDQMGTTHTVFGSITTVSANEWSWQARTDSGNERYTNGVIRRNSGGTGFTATADYAFTTVNGCTETYKATFTIAPS